MADGPEQDEKTEEPTQRRLDQAHERGDVPKSQEVSTFMALAALLMALTVAASWSARQATHDLRGFLEHPHLVPSGTGALLGAGRHALETALRILVVPIGMVVVAVLAGGLVQHKLSWSLEALAPKFNRLSPLSGLARMFGKAALANFGKGLLKIAVVGTLAASLLWGEHDRLDGMVGLDPASLLPLSLALALKLLGLILAVHAVLAIADYAAARWSWHGRQRMTKQELKEEMKDQDGNPEIKAKIRQLQRERLKKRMMAAVPDATVIVTNPTHYAVALRWETGQAAPVCVAKGLDELALRIQAVAREHDVPVVENPPLARALHASVDVDDEIPVEHYRAVAEVIGFVLRLRRRAS